ncbi:Uncharacterised protein [uncultured archaeon]|nr:Uncharacterised protein [uncultured archaeon]
MNAEAYRLLLANRNGCNKHHLPSYISGVRRMEERRLIGKESLIALLPLMLTGRLDHNIAQRSIRSASSEQTKHTPT